MNSRNHPAVQVSKMRPGHFQSDNFQSDKGGLSNIGAGTASRQSGFSLIELIAVVAILGILAAVVAPNILQAPGKARITRTKADITSIVSALQTYKLDNFSFPTTDQGLMALVEQPTGDPEAPNWQDGGYLPRMPKDPWGRDYLYVSPGENSEIDVYSLGADGQSGGEKDNADIGNWEEPST